MLSGCPYDINGIALSHFSHDSLFSHVDYRWITNSRPLLCFTLYNQQLYNFMSRDRIAGTVLGFEAAIDCNDDI